MSLHDQLEFIKSIHPFGVLTNEQLNKVQKTSDIAYYGQGTILISPKNASTDFFIIVKGEVSEYNDEDLSFVYHEKDSLDPDSLMYEKTESTFKVTEDLICYQLPRKTFMTLIEENEEFKNFYLNNVSGRLQELQKKEYASELSDFMVSRVNQIYLGKPCVVDFNTPLKDAIGKGIEYKTSSVIVKKGDEYGIITDSVLKKDVLLTGYSLEDPVGHVAKFPFICVDYDEFLFQVLLIVTKHKIKRVGVLKDGELIGILEQLSILSFFANHSHLISVQIENANTKEELKNASLDIGNTIKTLHSKGVKTNYIAKLVGELNLRVYEKLFTLILPKELQEKSCLIVMGSEGRNEQILKTDQDNGLIIDNDIDPKTFYPYMEEFTNTLIQYGFPRCDGNIMVSNPYWCKTQKEYEEMILDWTDGNDMESFMNFAIFFDSKPCGGNYTLSQDLKEKLFHIVDGRDVFMAYFAKATLSFETPIGMFSKLKLKKNKIDIKKGGIFSIVHGVRSLSLEYKINELSTIARIKKLNQKGVIDRTLASEIIEAFSFLSALKLKTGMESFKKKQPINNFIDIDEIGKLERDMLKDSFKIINNFKNFISNHFRLSNIQ